MAAVSMQRQPFGELGPAQLQQLSSTKNRQNAITDSLSKPGKLVEKAFASPPKRTIDLSIFDDNEDSENIDPSSFQTKRAKAPDGTPTKKPLLGLTDSFTPLTEPSGNFRSPLSSNVHFENISSSSLGQKRKAETSASSTPLSAPAGRSPKHKRIGILSRKRNSLSPFRRIDPPAFGFCKTSQGGLPFSIDEALSGTLSSHAVKAIAPTIEESMPKGWLFEIHEDTPDEEAANMMEHSACTLDISDDECQRSTYDDRGKENIPPLDHPQPEPGNLLEEKAARSRQTATIDAMLDEGEDRRPLGDLPAVDFYDEGLDTNSKIVIAVDDEKASTGVPADTCHAVIAEKREGAAPVDLASLATPLK